MKSCILLMCQIPPPTTGAAVIGSYVTGSKRLRDRYDLTVVPIQMTEKVSELGKLSSSKIFKSFGLFGRLTAELARKPYAAVYFAPAISGAAFFRDVVLVSIAKAFGRKRILHIHMRGVADAYQASGLYRLCYRLLFAGADVIHLSETLFDDLKDLVPATRRHVVANGVLASASSKPTADNASLDRSGPTVLYLSNLMLEKGPLDLLEAGLRLLRSGTRFKLVFVGAVHVPEVGERIKLAAAEFPEYVVLRPAAYGAEKQELLAAADIFAFPSYYRHECQSLAVIEAMANGLAILASRVGGTPDLVRDRVTGLLHDARDVEGIERGLRSLIDDLPLRRGLGSAAQRAYVENYTLASFDRRFADTIDRIVDLK